MKTERELFQEKYLAKINTYAKFNQSKYTEEYEDCKEQACWEMWQASASREGYKLVPVEPTIAMVRAYYETPKPTAERCYKAMIGVIG